MANPLIFQDLSGLSEGISSLGTSLGQGIQALGKNYQDDQEKQKNKTILSQTIGDLGPDATPTQIMSALQQAIARGVPAETVKTAFSVYEPFIKGKLEEESDLRLFGKNPENLVDNEVLNDLKIDTNDASPQELQPKNQNQLQRLSDETLTKMLASKRYGKWAEGELKRRELEQKKTSDLWNYKPTQKFIETIDNEAKDAEFGNEVADQVIRLAESGRVSPSNFRNFAASQFGDKLPFLFTPESAEFKFLEKLQAKGLTAYFPRPTEREFLFINAAQAQLGKSDQANISIAQLQKKFNNIPIQLADIKDQIIEENGGAPPRDLAAKARKRSRQIKDSIVADSAAITYRYGSEDQRKEAKDYLDSIKSPIPHQLTPLPKSAANRIYNLAKGDKELAKQIALEEGYDINEVIDGQ